MRNQSRRLVDMVRYLPSLMTSFFRLRTSTPLTLFSSKQITNDYLLFWDDQQVSGAGTASVYNDANASTTLSVSGGVAGKRVRQTKNCFDYQPGRGQKVTMTGVFGEAVPGVIKRIGLFDDDNGLFFELSGSEIFVGIRNNGVDTLIPQSQWNFDKLFGFGLSEYTIDYTKGQIFFIDFEWLSLGQVRFGVFRAGEPAICHTQDHVNILDGPYMSNPNLPARYEIENDGTGAAANLKAICVAVESEGGTEDIGISRSVDRGVSQYETGNNTSLHPLLSIRLKDGYQHVTVRPERISAVCESTSDFRWALFLNPTVAGTDNAVWIPVTQSGIEYDISRDNTNTLSGGYQLASGYVSDRSNFIDLGFAPQSILGSTIAGVTDQLVLAVQNITTTGSESYLASLQYRER